MNEYKFTISFNLKSILNSSATSLALYACKLSNYEKVFVDRFSLFLAFFQERISDLMNIYNNYVLWKHQTHWNLEKTLKLN